MAGIQRSDEVRLPDEALDQILAVQLSVAWAGEARTDPPRLGWWHTSLYDELGGLDLFRRLTPRTQVWAALEATRLAARKVDAALGAESADADLLLSLFRLGHDVDEQLDDRLAAHKRHELPPQEAVPLAIDLQARFDRDQLAAWLSSLAKISATEPTPVGRRLRGTPPADLVATVRQLAASLVPLVPAYPAPYYRLGRG